MSDEFLKATMNAAKSGEIPPKVTNRMLWAMAIDAMNDRKTISSRITKLELRAAAFGGAAGLIAAIAALIAAM